MHKNIQFFRHEFKSLGEISRPEKEYSSPKCISCSFSLCAGSYNASLKADVLTITGRLDLPCSGDTMMIAHVCEGLESLKLWSITMDREAIYALYIMLKGAMVWHLKLWRHSKTTSCGWQSTINWIDSNWKSTYVRKILLLFKSKQSIHFLCRLCFSKTMERRAILATRSWHQVELTITNFTGISQLPLFFFQL